MQKRRYLDRGFAMLCVAALAAGVLWSESPSKRQGKRGQIALKSGQSSTAEWRPLATIDLGGEPDWMAVTDDAVWISNQKLNAIHRVDPRTNKTEALIRLPASPCSGLVFAFGSLWVPMCGEERTLVRIDAETNRVIATLPYGPGDSEGSITASEDSIWIVIDSEGSLLKIDPEKNEVRQMINVPPGSSNPMYSDGVVWVTGATTNVLTPVNAKTGEVMTPIAVGPQPRFLTAGAGAIWTLNQGDGSVTRVDTKTKKVVATIAAGISGSGGEISFGEGSIWATVMDFPLTKIDAKTNKVEKQWVGPGGDSVRFGHNTIWLTDLHRGLLWRLPVM